MKSLKEVLIGEKVLRRLGNPCEKPKGLEPEDGLPFESLGIFHPFGVPSVRHV